MRTSIQKAFLGVALALATFNLAFAQRGGGGRAGGGGGGGRAGGGMSRPAGGGGGGGMSRPAGNMSRPSGGASHAGGGMPGGMSRPNMSTRPSTPSMGMPSMNRPSASNNRPSTRPTTGIQSRPSANNRPATPNVPNIGNQLGNSGLGNGGSGSGGIGNNGLNRPGSKPSLGGITTPTRPGGAGGATTLPGIANRPSLPDGKPFPGGGAGSGNGIGAGSGGGGRPLTPGGDNNPFNRPSTKPAPGGLVRPGVPGAGGKPITKPSLPDGGLAGNRPQLPNGGINGRPNGGINGGLDGLNRPTTLPADLPNRPGAITRPGEGGSGTNRPGGNWGSGNWNSGNWNNGSGNWGNGNWGNGNHWNQNNSININNNFGGGGWYGHYHSPGWSGAHWGSWYHGSCVNNNFWGGFATGVATTWAVSAWRQPYYYYSAYSYAPAGWSSNMYGNWGLGYVANDWMYAGYANPYASTPATQTVIVQVPAANNAAATAPVVAYDYAKPIDVLTVSPEQDTAEQAQKIFESARESFRGGDASGALALADQALTKLPSDPVLHEFRALTLFALQRYDEAAAVVYAVLSAGPGWDWSTLVGLYADTNTYTAQLRNLESAAVQHPESASTQFLLAYHYLVQGHKPEAAAQFAKVTTLLPNDAVSSKLAKGLNITPPSPSSSATPSRVAEATGDSTQNAGPASEVAPPPPPAFLVGSWKATPSDKVSIALDLNAEGAFAWSVAESGRKQVIEGKAGFENDVLVLGQEDGPPLVGKLTFSADKQSFTFKPPATSEEAEGLTFTKSSK